MKKIGIIGHFGCGLQFTNGQTVKTNMIFNTLAKEYKKDDVMQFDTHGGIKFMIKMPFILIRALKRCQNIIIMPAHKGICVITPFLLFFNIFFNRPIHYVVIGGWLSDMLASKKWLLYLVKKFKYIYIETERLNLKLKELGLDNTIVMPNFKQIHPCNNISFYQQPPYPICTFSRVTKEKGIFEAISAIKKANETLGENIYSLDIYGQIENETWFAEIMSNQPNYIQYKGCISPNKSTETLNKYFALLFPTYYPGECFAGTIIDSFFAGLPVFASDWHDNPDIIRNMKTGIIFKSKSIDAITESLLFAYKSPNIINQMRMNCIDEAMKYEPKGIIQILTSKL